VCCKENNQCKGKKLDLYIVLIISKKKKDQKDFIVLSFSMPSCQLYTELILNPAI
jgi:hypothetical protein